jgi:hypothetical protein
MAYWQHARELSVLMQEPHKSGIGASDYEIIGGSMMKRGKLQAVLAVGCAAGLTVGLYLANHDVSLPIAPSAFSAAQRMTAPAVATSGPSRRFLKGCYRKRRGKSAFENPILPRAAAVLEGGMTVRGLSRAYVHHDRL